MRGAKGLKLHPILQNVPLTDERTYAAVEVFGELGLPITSHCGINDYYKPGSKYQALAPKEYGELHYMLALIERYPDYILIQMCIRDRDSYHHPNAGAGAVFCGRELLYRGNSNL